MRGRTRDQSEGNRTEAEVISATSRIRYGIGLRWLMLLLTLAVGAAFLRQNHPDALSLAAALVLFYVGLWEFLVLRLRRPLRSWLFRFAACSLAILLGIGVFELAGLFRVIDYRRVFASPTVPWDRPGNRADEKLLYIKQGHQRIRESYTGNETALLDSPGPWPVYKTDRTYDRDGFRNPRDLEKADVVVVGDSFIEGAHVTEDQLITKQLERELGGKKTVINLGQAGYGPQQILEVLRRFGIPRKPAYCVWAFYEGNDLADITEYKTKREKFTSSRRSKFDFHSDVVDLSFTYNALGYLLRNWIDPAPRLFTYQFRGWLKDDRGGKLPLYFANGDHRRASHTTNSVEPIHEFREILREAATLCDNHGVKLIVAFIPTKLRVYFKICDFDQNAVCPRWILDTLPEVIGRVAQEVSDRIEYVDLTPSFHAEAARGTLLYLPDDTHWTAAGHQSAAREIARRIHD